MLISTISWGCIEKYERGNHQLEGRLIVDGSATVYPITLKCAELFMEMHPKMDIQVYKTGSGTGIKSLIEGKSQIANTSRPIKQTEYDRARSIGKSPQMTVVGNDALTVIVHPSNPIDDISKEELRSIFFSGDITKWSALGTDNHAPIQPMGPDPTKSGTGDFFTELFSSKTLNKNYDFLDHSSDVHSKIAIAPNGIGFTSLKYAKEAAGTVKILSVDGVFPTRESILNTSYAMSRRLYIINDGRPTGAERKFINYMLSIEGQQIVDAKGYISIY